MNIQEAQKLEKTISQTLKKHLKSVTSIILGVSGGPDSMFLLHSTLNFFQKSPKISSTKKLKHIPKIIIAHINHNLRGLNSKKDEKFIDNHIKNLQKEIHKTKSAPFELNLYSKSSKIKQLSLKSKENLEETGRKARYGFFTELAKTRNAQFVLTAHHADDNLETILLNLARGATLQGLCGMQEIDEMPYTKLAKLTNSTTSTSATRLLRPLLQITKKQIISYLKFKKIPYRIDESNFSNNLNRNLIRNKIIPELKKINPNLAQTTAKNTSNLREINNFLTQKAKIWLKQSSKKTHTQKTPKITSIILPAKTFHNLNPAIQKQIILEAYKNLIGDTKNLETTHLQEILKIINRNIGNKYKKLGKTQVSIKNNIITIKSSK